ncbi:unnamed protein product [Euphydryas editha]|uniref:LITAF domain-containing protein n=1 Tax=Euphydryas editha TaxID=104508 RepID=A0AAU9U235_EUPED|nr:unnamed protein product [Euphydryas editha]
MKGDMQTHMDPPTEPPPYPGPPAGSSYPGEIPGQSYPNNFNHPPPPFSQSGVTVIQPNNRTAMIHTGTIVVTNNMMGPKPTVYVCPSCNQQSITTVVRTPTMRTHMFALFLCVLGCWPCVCVPYCVDSCKSAEHYCTNCKAYLGSHSGL